ncbi:MAG: hypothetical protein K9H64_21945 [Bacteroidales bacterium]|nr:hypothetical protein [Bacteroidales bacterium]
MKKILFIFCLMLGQIVYGQHLPFQGKLLENGLPVNGLKTFQFSITNGGVNWNETQTVQVNNGLYLVMLGSVSPLQPTLFIQQVPLNLMVQVNGNTLDTVQIYPPIETDPTVPSNLKDGVQWGDIQNLPTLDYNSANELQNLILNGSVLSISQGNSVTLPAVPHLIPNDVTIDGKLQVGVQDTTPLSFPTAIPQGNIVVGNNIWQSFIPTNAGTLVSVELMFGSMQSSNTIKLKIYPGEGTTGQVLYDHTYPASQFGTGISNQTIPIVNQSINLVCGTQYTFQVIGISQDMGVIQSLTNAYTGGISSLGASIDLVFNINLAVITPVSLFVNSTGNVGIGTQTPSAKLEIVNQSCSSSDALLKVGNTQNPNVLQVLNSGNVGIGTGSPTQKLEVVGNTKVDGNLEVTGSLTIGGIFGSWVDKSSSYGIQQAYTDGFVIGFLQPDSPTGQIYGFTDSSSNPTTIRGGFNGSSAGQNIRISFCMPVRKNDYWKVTCSDSSPKVYWIPIGN